ncbi:YihY/virulence factor BrkB family protein, partial [Nocardioides sp.]|uniref:YihY/virulence factor BrkB family protein n=1 Tax=Nocardioides sp. TaxID=35761 RepID=UPI002B277649
MTRTDEATDGRRRSEEAPSAEADVKPDDPTDLDARSRKYVARKTLHEFTRDECTDLAAALTYYAVLALFPALIALMSLVGLLGQGQEAARTVLQILRDVGASGAADTLEPTLTELSQGSGAGLALVIGLLAAL